MNVNYTYTPRVFGDTIEITIKNNEAVIGVKLFSLSYTIESAISDVKFEGENFGFSFNGVSYPPQKNNTTDSSPSRSSEENITSDTSTSGVSFDISRITLTEEPDVTNIATSQINQTLNTQELETTKKLLLLALPFEVKLISILNAKKEEIQSKLIPFIVRQLTPFGTTVVQFIINNPAFYKTRVNPQEVAPLLDELKEYISCPNERVVTQLINKRNKTATQINNLYHQHNF
jgi:hypothetical protein